ncbi:MAG: hypothetical protein A3H97_24965 [Acidobacteria bacterium RIFCSPLOWO2_02_FULL_65_29]|nr:MAG: hypothetical protein A3H97_24965 [Acidobacteria bacterium RIFCSPLOWO2_02_FULL_65_29]
MVSRRSAVVVLAALIVSGLLPGRLYAQSAIAGVVKDATGAVLPGVTVEAASPVLIEKVRTVVTDEAGQYLIVDLRPGVYSVTFTLEGFSTLRRDGIELPTSFTATVNADLRIGALEETINVSGQSPVVDMRSATQQQVLNKELLESVPTGRNLWGTGATLTGVTLNAPDVGGTGGMQQVYMTVHGSQARDNAIQVDGMSVNGIEGNGAIQQYFNQGMFEEWSYQTSALSAEVQGSGVRMNMVPKDGGNIFKGSMFWSHTPGEWQSNNFTSALRATGLRAPNRVDQILDLNLGLGGPVVKERLWFFSSFRRWGVDQTISDSFYNLDPTYRTYKPDLSRPTVDDNLIKSGVVRLTYQMTSQHKFAAYLDRIVKFRGHECNAPTAEEACGIRWPKLYFTAQAKYTGTLSNRVLVEAGWSENNESYNTQATQASVKPTDIGRSDRITSEKWSSVIGPYYFRAPIRHTFVGSLSYVTGSHAFKTGFQLGKGGNNLQRSFPNGLDLYQEYRNGVPASVVVYNTPQDAAETIKYDLGLYAQDSWKYKRLTLNPGLRIELFNSYIRENGAPAGRFVPARHFDAIEDMPNWKDTAPRFGLVYDVLGDGKTAVKAHVGKYVTAFSTTGFAEVYDPMVVQTDRRTWSDPNRDDIAQDNEIGPVQTPFNISGVTVRTPDPDIERPYQWEYNVGVQRELTNGLSISAGWVRREFRRLFWTDNVLTTFDDYTAVQILSPLDGTSIPVYNLNVAKRGQVRQIDKNSDRNRRSYNGVDIGFTSRVGGGNLFGGVNAGRQIATICEVDDPNNLRFCDQHDLDVPYLTQFKLAGMYPLPYGVQLSGSWQGYPGAQFSGSGDVAEPSLNVNYIVDRTIVPTLTQSSVTVQLVEPGTKFLKRWNQIDVRLGRKFQFRNVNVQGQFDIFNLLNSSSILAVTQTFGPSLDRPTRILQGRLFAVGAQVNF